MTVGTAPLTSNVSALAVGLGALLLATAALPQTPAESQIAVAEERVQSRPQDSAGHRELAVALTRRARETGDASYYERALTSLARARERREAEDPTELDTIEAWVRLGRHEFARAEALARRVLAREVDDPEAQGLLGDALIELGRYEEAASAYQRLLDLRPGPGSYVRAAHYREVTGDLEGALELLSAALAATPGRESEERAWILVQMAGVQAALAGAQAADALCAQALSSFPGYHNARAGRARLALRVGDAIRAEAFARAALEAAPHPEYRLLLADALHASGRVAEAREEEQQFEREALANLERADNENVFLVDFYLDRQPDPGRALELAREEAERRADLGTLSRLARALDRNGRRGEARALMERVLAVGTRDPDILAHARAIGVGQPAAAERPAS